MTIKKKKKPAKKRPNISVKSTMKESIKEKGEKGKYKSKIVEKSLKTGENEMSSTREVIKEKGEKGTYKSKTKFIKKNKDGSHTVTNIRQKGEKGKIKTRKLRNNVIGRMRAKYIKGRMVRRYKK
mgnify:CR=1 FL=1|tara:strand:+ start:447 stop:821 length:375 start_codon:yes stop_codon:yes gene_type:complete